MQAYVCLVYIHCYKCGLSVAVTDQKEDEEKEDGAGNQVYNRRGEGDGDRREVGRHLIMLPSHKCYQYY